MNEASGSRKFSRRTMLRGSCGFLALPYLSSLEARTPPVRPPARFVVVYVPNGMHMSEWSPSEVGALPESLPKILEPLSTLREQLLVLSGLGHDKARANGDGPGDHARAAGAFLTAAQPKKTAGRDLRAGISFDQVIARGIGARTPLSSLEIGGERGRQSGECDSGYACVYSNNLAWSAPDAPLPPETDPRQLFDRLFGGGESAEARAERIERAQRRTSLLDYLRDDARDLSLRLGTEDRKKLDQYLSAVRDLEHKLQALDREDSSSGVDLSTARPERSDDFESRSLAFADVLALALATDRTRVATWLIANEGSNRSYPHLGVKDGHHEISHHGGDEKKQAQILRINCFHASVLAHLLQRLAAQKEEGGSVLDHTIVLYGSGIADGNSHAHLDLPLLLAGGSALGLRGGRHVRYPAKTPAANMFLCLAECFGVEIESFGDSTGTVSLKG